VAFPQALMLSQHTYKVVITDTSQSMERASMSGLIKAHMEITLLGRLTAIVHQQ